MKYRSLTENTEVHGIFQCIFLCTSVVSVRDYFYDTIGNSICTVVPTP